MQNRILILENGIDLKVSKTQKIPYGLRWDGFNSAFFIFHIDATNIYILKKGYKIQGGKKFQNIYEKKRVFDILDMEANEISEKEGKIQIPTPIKLTFNFLEFSVYKDIKGKLREAIEYIQHPSIILDPLKYYPVIIRRRKKTAVLEEKNTFSLSENVLNIIYKRLGEIWGSFGYYIGKNIMFDQRDVILTFEKKQTYLEVEVNVVDLINF